MLPITHHFHDTPATITALVRTHPGREERTKRAIASAYDQGCDVIVYQGEKVSDYSYNPYCDTLARQVKEGWFFFLDSDDYVLPGAIAAILSHLRPTSLLIVQMIRNGRAKPSDGRIRSGHIGMPCIVIPSIYASELHVPPVENGDYVMIQDMCSKFPYEFKPIPLVNAGKRGYGR